MFKKIMQEPSILINSIAPSFADNKLGVIIEKNEPLTPGRECSTIIFKPDSLHKEYTAANGTKTKIFHELSTDLLTLHALFNITIRKQLWMDLSKYPKATDMLNTHYVEHYNDYTNSNGTKKTWFPDLINFMSGLDSKYPGPVHVWIAEGPAGTVDILREFCLFEMRNGKSSEEYDYRYYTEEVHIAVTGVLDKKYQNFVDNSNNIVHLSANKIEAEHEVRNIQAQIAFVLAQILVDKTE